MMSFSPSTPSPLPSTTQSKRISFIDPTTSPLFSPSAAARYAQQTEQWNQVEKWLARVFFPNRVPEFEKTEETLKYLHQLSSISTQRTKERQALNLVQERMVKEYSRRASETRTQVNNLLGESGLSQSTEEMLSELIELGMVLKIDPLIGGVFDIAKGISEQCDKEMELELRVHETQFMEQKLQAELEKMIALRTRLQQSTWNQEMKQDTIDEKISEWTRGIKLIQAKTEEYQSRTTAAKDVSPDIRISALVEDEEKVTKLKEKVKEIQKRVDGYAMLPCDEKGARREVEKLRAELERLRRKRDALWEDATGG